MEFDQRHHITVDHNVRFEHDPLVHEIRGELRALRAEMRTLMAGQEDIDAAVAALGVDNARILAAAARIQAELDTMQAAGVDTTALVAALGELDAATGVVENVGAVVTPPAE
jgi:hypothetical protein